MQVFIQKSKLPKSSFYALQKIIITFWVFMTDIFYNNVYKYKIDSEKIIKCYTINGYTMQGFIEYGIYTAGKLVFKLTASRKKCFMDKCYIEIPVKKIITVCRLQNGIHENV